jgi:sortase A
MATVSTVPARSNEGPSGRRPRRRVGGRRWPPRRAPRTPVRYAKARRPEGRLSFRRVVRGIGKTLIATGILIFLFVAYELWGTGIAERRGQNVLKAQFARQLGTTVPALPGADTTPTSGPPETVAGPVALGNAAAQIRIPKIGLEKFVVEGVGVEDLKVGPGHYPDTPMPGQPGNAAIAGHRTTYGAPFGDLDRLNPGDPILVTTSAGVFNYQVDHETVVDPSEVSVLDNTPDNRLTLTTCNPKYSAAQRLVVVAKLTSAPTQAPKVAPGDAGPATAPPARARSGLAGLSGKSTERGPAIAWGALAALVWALSWWVGRWWRRWLAYLLGAPVFLVVLFVFFENFSRLLPANV